MKLGLLFPTCDIGSDPIAIRDYVEAAEGLGFDRLLCFDHVLRRLWTEPVVDYHGRFHRIDRAGILPRPASPIPIWFGGASPQAYERAARLGDGFVFRPDDREYGSALARIRERMATLGRDPGRFGAECSAAFALGPEHWLRLFDHWQRAGGTHFSVQLTEYGAERLGAR